MTNENATKGHWKELSVGYDEALERLPEELKKEGFGVITQIDMRETLKAKIGVDFRRYRIVGACNPTFAHRALLEDPRIGLLLPCNFVVYERDDGKAVVGAIDPMQTLGEGAVAGPFADIARDVGARLDRVLAALPA